MRRFLLLLFFLIPGALTAQEGRIRFDRVVRYGFEVPENLPASMRDQIPGEQLSPVVLAFTATESLMVPEADSVEETGVETERPIALVLRLRQSSTSRGDHETFMETFTRFEDGMVAETRNFMTRDFLISGERAQLQWRLGADQAQFLGHLVQKATAVHDSATVEAWFTPEIPVPGGPGIYGGLPGMILLLNVNDGELVYTATAIEMGGTGDLVIEAPEGGASVTRREYEDTVAEKLEELRTSRRRQ